MRRLLAAPLAAVALSVSAGVITVPGDAWAQTIDKREFNVVGTWNFLTNFQQLERPFFSEVLPKASNGNLKGTVKAVNELNLKGTELLRMMKQGVFDMVFALPIYVEDGGAIIEAVDLSGVSRTFDMNREIANAWMPEMQQVMREKHNALILATHTWPEQNFYCRGDVKSVEDLKGKKVRVQGTSQADLVSAFGATGVTITFAEVVPALEKGVVDCGITGTMPAYKAGWHEVVTHVIEMPVGFTIIYSAASMTTWRRLDGKSRDFLTTQMKAFEDKAWKTIADEVAMGLICTTGQGGTCSEGKPGKVIKVQPSADDLKLRDTALKDTVLKRWAKRCGAECVAAWNDTVGKLAGITAAP